MLRRTARLAPAPFLVAAVLACASGSESPTPASDPTPVATIAGETVTVGELDAWIKDQLFQQASRAGNAAKLHELRSRAIDDLIKERLLDREAAARGVDRETLLRQELERRSSVTPEEAQVYYDTHKEEFEKVDPEQALQRIQQSLSRSRQRSALDDFVSELKEKAGVSIALETPRVQVAANGPSLGPDQAAVTIIEFSDYQCPFCSRAEPVVKELLKRYPEDVRFVYRHFPLTSIHPRAWAASEAAVCAEEQGRFWDYHEKVFANAGALENENLIQYATELELDTDAFETCLTEGHSRKRVEADYEDGRQAGVSGTPMFFVNGIPLSGARPVEDFVRLIEGELGRKGS